jgi:hypothetical protein
VRELTWRVEQVFTRRSCKLRQAEQTKLHEAEDDTISKAYLNSVKDDFIKEGLLFHKDKEVRASLACCLADMLRLYAPEPPYEEVQLPVSTNWSLVPFLFGDTC